MKKLKHIINWTVWTIMGLYALLMVAVQLPMFQQFIGNKVAAVLEKKLGTRVSVGSIDIGFLNRIIIDDILIYDQQQKEMLRAGRLTAKVELVPLTQGKIAISSAQIFGVRASLYRANDQSDNNFQFIIDSLSSKNAAKHTPLDLHINSFIVRHSSINYDVWDIEHTPNRLNPNHLHIHNISAHIILKALKEDSINIKVKRMAFKEQSGLEVRRMGFQLTANNTAANINNFTLQLPESTLNIDSLIATFASDRLKETIHYQGTISNTHIIPSELRCFVPWLKNYKHSISISTSFQGTSNSVNIPQLTIISQKGDLMLRANGHYKSNSRQPEWQANINEMRVNSEILNIINKNVVPIPDAVFHLGDVQLSGNFGGDELGTLIADAEVTTDAGSIKTNVQWTENHQFNGHIFTERVCMDKILGNDKLGLIAANLDVSGKLDGDKLVSLTVSGTIPTFSYDGYNYQHITLNGQYMANNFKGWLTIDDDRIRTKLEADLCATSLDDAVGVVCLTNLRLPEKDFALSFLRLETGYENSLHFVRLYSDFAHTEVKGQFNYVTLGQSLANIIGSRLPTLPGLPTLTHDSNNNFTIHMAIAETEWLQKLTSLDLLFNEPIDLTATINDGNHLLNVEASIPNVIYNGECFENGHISIITPNDSMLTDISLTKIQSNGKPLQLRLLANAANNNLTTLLQWDNYNAERHINGRLGAIAHLYRNASNKPEARVTILPSPIHIGDEQWNVETSDMIYSPGHLTVNRFTIKNGEQYIKVNGHASKQTTDSLFVDLNKVEVAYILDLVNFHAVDFGGKATGHSIITSAFDAPTMHTNLTVDNFTFMDGRMGTLTASVDWNRQLKQIDIDAVADDGPDAQTLISGYVSPEHNYIDLNIKGLGTHIDFIRSFTESFLSNISGQAHGEVNLHGPLSNMQLTGELVVDGQATVTVLGTTYTLRGDTIRLVTNDILLQGIPIYDKHDNVGILNGGIHHEHLTNLTFDLGVHTDLLLGYDQKDSGDQIFYGTVYAAGDVAIQGRPGRVTIDCDVTPLQGSLFTYNVASPDALSKQEFITWQSRHQELSETTSAEPKVPHSATDIYLNFNIYATPEGTMRLLMDANTGDYITLNGSGVLRATYYNKGAFNMFGTYTVDHGTYGITIQNIIKKNFMFNAGGTIIFGGDPYDAAIHLQASYPVQGVSLTDLSIGNSFTQATIRVNCLMNITGQPNAPRVDFDIDMPTVNADEQQMVRSLINGEQEMNQQVLYLLTIGRFYQQGQNNEQSSQDQTSLAMQSLLSGTISSQINTILSSVIKNDDWNFGANISTGTEGWNNAEYEGIVNGRMLNNRLLINGQFGYRDNATQATPSFIGDFDIRYLLYPSGNLALKVYNQTNDRYFTRSSLNTQGIGIIMKKDFGRLDELFRKR